MSRFKLVSAAVLASSCGVLLVGTLATPDAEPPDWRATLRAELAPLIHPDATPCGEVGLGESLYPARHCVSRAIRERRPFWLVAQGRGKDSQVWRFVGSDALGKLQTVDFDSQGWEHRGVASFIWTEERQCATIRFGERPAGSQTQHGEPPVSCT